MSTKHQKLNTLTEAEFREEVIIPLLIKMGYERVRLRHGPQEYGKDVTYCEPSKLTSATHYAVVAKVGKISGAASGRDSILIQTIKDQIIQAFTIPIEDVTDTRSHETYVNQVIVWTTDTISDNAQKRIIKDIKVEYRNNVTFVDGDTTIEHLEKYYPSFFTIGDKVISSYFEKSKSTYNRLAELYTIGGTNAQKSLPVVFVSPTLEHIPRIRSKQAKQEKLPNKRYSFSRLIEHKTNILLLGEMGSGKSTILRRLLIEIIEENEKNLQKSPIPVLVRYKNLDLKESDPILHMVIEEYCRLSDSSSTDDVMDGFIAGNFIILLDGLDELDSERDIDAAIESTLEFIQSYPKAKIMVASRMMEVFKTNNFAAKFAIYKIEDFSLTQMKELITKWFGSGDPNGKQLIKLISEPMTLSTLPFTPLTLALIAILYQSGFNELPANLTELFEKYTELALGRWDMGKDLASQIDWKKKHLVMRKIGWDMLETYNTEIDDRQIKEYITRLSTERGLTIDVNLFFKEMVERAGLLLKNIDGNFEFKHRAFMDYFAGGELNSKSDAVQFVVDNFPNPWWSRVIFFACGLQPESEGEAYLKAIITQINKDDCGAFHYALQLGLLAQATYLAHQDTKIEAVRKSILAFIEAWDDLALSLHKAYESGKIKKQIPHLFLLYIFSGIVRLSLGSLTLSGALSLLVRECIENKENLTNVNDLERRKNEWITFCLAIASANANNINDFIMLFDSNIIIDPGLLQIGEHEAEFLLDDEWITKEEKNDLQEMLKSIRKKLKNSAEYLNSLASQKPLLLNGSYSEQDDSE